MTEKTPLNEAIEKVQDQIKMIKGFKQSALERKEDDTKYQLVIQELQLVVNSILNPLLSKERQNLIDAADSKFVILEKVIDSNGAKVTYQSGKDYVKDKFGI